MSGLAATNNDYSNEFTASYTFSLRTQNSIDASNHSTLAVHTCKRARALSTFCQVRDSVAACFVCPFQLFHIHTVILVDSKRGYRYGPTVSIVSIAYRLEPFTARTFSWQS